MLYGQLVANTQTDRVVKLWDLHQENLTAPSRSFSGPVVSP